MRRFYVAGISIIALACGVAPAQAAKPTTGDWSGGGGATFTVNSAGSKITKFFPSGCASYGVLYPAMKVKSNGTFALKTHASTQGGPSLKLTVKGTFTSPTTAKVTVKYGRCTRKFSATASTPAVQPDGPVGSG